MSNRHRNLKIVVSTIIISAAALIMLPDLANYLAGCSRLLLLVATVILLAVILGWLSAKVSRIRKINPTSSVNNSDK